MESIPALAAALDRIKKQYSNLTNPKTQHAGKRNPDLAPTTTLSHDMCSLCYLHPVNSTMTHQH